jgi:prepilin-type N-terminal cleavage/methylation domain-containing protein
MTTSRRGFSLIEVAAAMAIAALVAVAALQATVNLNRSFVANRKRVQQADDGRITLEHVLTRVRNAGGGPIRPWQAISVTCATDPSHPLPACDAGNQQRRLHVAEVDPSTQGSIVSFRSRTVTVRTIAGVCPLPTTGSFTAIIFPPDNQLQSLGGAAWRTGTCMRKSTCSCELLAGSGVAGFSPPGDLRPSDDDDFDGGTIIKGLVSSFYVDPASSALMVLSDQGRVGAAFSTALMPGVFAFDMRLLYDVDGDGGLDTVTQRTQLTTAPTALRGVRVDLALRTKAADGIARPASLFGDTLRETGSMLISVEGSGLVRANGLFQ